MPSAGPTLVGVGDWLDEYVILEAWDAMGMGRRVSELLWVPLVLLTVDCGRDVGLKPSNGKPGTGCWDAISVLVPDCDGYCADGGGTLSVLLMFLLVRDVVDGPSEKLAAVDETGAVSEGFVIDEKELAGLDEGMP